MPRVRCDSCDLVGTSQVSLHVRLFAPAQVPLATLVIVHGFGEHGGRYRHLIDPWVHQGIQVISYDQRGFGRSGGQRGHIDRWADYRSDLDLVLGMTRRIAANQPILLWGHSLGALVALERSLRRPVDVSGLILSGTPLNPAGVGGWDKIALAYSLSLIWPTYSVALGLAGRNPVADPTIRQWYGQDPLVHGQATVRWGTESMKARRWVHRNLERLRTPTLLIHGQRDPINLVDGAEQLYDRVTQTTKRLIIYPEAFHEPHNDRERHQVIADLSDWIFSRVEAEQTPVQARKPHLLIRHQRTHLEQESLAQRADPTKII